MGTAALSAGGILLAGCGDLGIRLGLLLAAAGRRVHGLRRDPAGLPAPIHALAADLAEARSLEVLPPGLSDLVYLAAADAFTEEAYRRAYVDGLRNVLNALDSPRRIVLVSSSSVFGQTDGSWVNEQSPTTADDFSQRCLLQGEQLALEAGGTVLRLSGIYGPGRTRLLERVRAGEATHAPGLDEWTNRIHVDDAASALEILLGLDSPRPVYLGVDDEPARRREVLEWLAERLGAPAPRVEEPPVRRPGRSGSSKRCSNRLLRSTGWRPRYPSWREGYESLIGGTA